MSASEQQIMNVLLDWFLLGKNVLLAFLMSWIRFFIPAKAKSVKGEIVLVTGAGSGVGQGIAVEFAKLGSVVVLWDINEEGLQETAKLISDVDGLCYTYICDVR